MPVCVAGYLRLITCLPLGLTGPDSETAPSDDASRKSESLQIAYSSTYGTIIVEQFRTVPYLLQSYEYSTRTGTTVLDVLESRLSHDVSSVSSESGYRRYIVRTFQRISAYKPCTSTRNKLHVNPYSYQWGRTSIKILKIVK